MRHLHSSLARVLLAIMFVTLSLPGLAWQANATHEEIAHTVLFDSSAQQHHDGAGTSHHDELAYAADHDDAAHGTIGHLLGHLPGVVSDVPTLPQIEPAALRFADIQVQSPRISPEPPLRPPRIS